MVMTQDRPESTVMTFFIQRRVTSFGEYHYEYESDTLAISQRRITNPRLYPTAPSSHVYLILELIDLGKV